MCHDLPNIQLIIQSTHTYRNINLNQNLSPTLSARHCDLNSIKTEHRVLFLLCLFGCKFERDSQRYGNERSRLQRETIKVANFQIVIDMIKPIKRIKNTAKKKRKKQNSLSLSFRNKNQTSRFLPFLFLHFLTIVMIAFVILSLLSFFGERFQFPY